MSRPGKYTGNDTEIIGQTVTPNDNLSNNRTNSATENEKEESSKSRRVDLDTVVKEIGQFGPFQWRLMSLCAVVAIFTAWTASEYLFTTARITTRCLIPECDSSPPVWSPGWEGTAIPPAGSALDNCQRFAPALNVSSSAVGLCPAELFDQNTLVNCEEYVYENSYSIVYDYDLACDEWRRTLIGSMRTVGTLLALPVTGYISDRWGRRVALTITAFNCAWIGVTRYWAATYVGFIISQMAESIVGSGIYTSAYILLIEVMDAKYRTAASAAMSSSFAFGQMTLGLIAWGVPYWKNLTLTLYIPQFFCILYLWIAPESVRWYMTKGRYENAEAVLHKIARTNGKSLPQISLESFRHTAEEDNKRQKLEKERSKNEPWLIVTVFKHKKVLLRCFVAPVWWITNTFIYYGLSINAVNMIGNRYLNFMAVAAVEIPGFWTAVFLINKIGRKPVLMAAFWICTACQIAYIFIPSDYYGLSLTFYLIGKCAIAMVALTIYVYTAELYPTKHRHTLFAFSSMIGRIGSIIAPLTPAFATATFDKFPFVLFGSFTLVSGWLVLLTPETLGTKLPDTMEEADLLYKT